VNCFAPPSQDSPASSSRLLNSTLNREVSEHAHVEAFLKIFHKDDRVLIVISADPDAIASAVAVKRLLWRRVSQVTVATISDMKRPDNLQLVKALSLKIESFSAVSPAVFTRYVMVDSQPGHSPLTEALAFQVIIDHHPLTVLSDNPEKRPVYIDIRPEIGATASLLAGYLKAAQIKPNFRLATALFYAIKTDTHNFVRQVQSLDMRAFRWLYSYINLDLLANIEKAPVARSSFKKLLAGLNGAVFYKNRVYTFLGRTDHADTLVLTADFLMKVSGVSQSLAAGICGRKLVIIFRAEGIRQDVGKLAQEAFGKFGSAGGHKNMARAEIYLENLDNKIRNNPVAIGRFVLRRLAGE